MSKIYATGATGTIGKYFGSKVEKLNLDLASDFQTFTKISLSKHDYVLHAAAIVGPTVVSKDSAKSYAVNVEGARNLATVALANNVSRFVYVSTSHVYAPSTELLNESSTVAPGNVYAEQKLQGENEIIDVYKGSPERLCIVRVFSVLDWDVSEFTLGGGIKKLALGVPEYELSNADDVRDFLTPKKIAEILIDIVNTPALSGVVNLSTGIGTSVREASRLMVEGSGFDFPLHRIIAGNSSFPFMVGDNSKLRWHLPNLDLSWVPSRWDGKEHP